MVGDVFHNIADFAVQNFAKHFNRMGADALVALEPRDLSGADVMVLNKGVLRNSFLLHNVPEIVIGNHFKSAPLVYLT